MKRIFFLFVFFSVCTALFSRWESFFFNDAGGIYSASSELEKPSDLMKLGRYSPKNLLDHDCATSWVEGDDGPGIGSYVLIGIQGHLKKYLIIYNGYQQSINLFKKNNRIKELKISLYAGFTSDERAGQTGFEADTVPYSEFKVIILKDKMGAQRFELSFDSEKAETFMAEEREKYVEEHAADLGKFGGIGSLKSFFYLKFEIVSVYKGSKWDDTCIAGIEFTDNSDGSYIPVNEKITKIYQNDNGGNVLIKTSSGLEMVLVSIQRLAEKPDTGENEFFTLSIMDVSPDNEWAVIDYQHGSSEGGSIEETHHLWSVRRMEEVPVSLLSAYGPVTPLDFLVKNGRIYLETYEGKNILLEDIAADLDSRS